MANINLVNEEATKIINFPFKGGLLAIGGAFLILAMIYAGLFFYGKSLQSKIDSAKQNYANKKAQFNAMDSIDLVDFKNRMDYAEGLLATKGLAVESLEDLSNRIIPNVFVESYNLDAGANTLEISCVADSFRTVAQQVLSLKGSAYFSNVSLGDNRLSEDGKAKFTISLKFKNN